MSGGEFAAIAAVVTACAFVQGAVGFGFGTMAAPVVALVAPVLVPGPLIVLGTVVAAFVALRARVRPDLRGTGWALLGRLLGSIPAALLVAVLPPRALVLSIAGIVLVSVLVSVVGWFPHPSRPAVFAAGAASGLMGTAAAIGGPPMAMVWQHSPGPQFRAAMSAFFLGGGLISLVALGTVGSFDREGMLASAALLPFVAVGFAASARGARHLDTRWVRAAALVVCAAGALLLMIKELV